MNLSNFFILKCILFILTIILVLHVFKNNMFYKNLKLIFTLFSLVFLCTPIYNFFYINYFIYLSHTTKLMKYDMKYKCIKIEEKFIHVSMPFFFLMLELIKIINFGQLYMFLDNKANPLSDVKYGYDSDVNKFIKHLDDVKAAYKKVNNQ